MHCAHGSAVTPWGPRGRSEKTELLTVQQYDIKECKAAMQQLVMVSRAALSRQLAPGPVCPACLRVCCGLNQQHDAHPPQNHAAVAWRHASGLH